MQAGRRHHQAHARGDLRALEHLRSRAQVIELGAGAGTDVSHVHTHLTELTHRPGVGRTVRRSHLRRQGGGIEYMGGSGCAFVTRAAGQVQHLGSRLAGGGQPLARGVVGCDQADLRAHLGTHVGQGHAFLHGQSLHRLTAKLNRLVLAAVHAEAADQMQRHVFGRHARAQAMVPLHADGFGHAHPQLAGDHHAQHLRAANAKHVGAKSTTCGRMRVATHAKHARTDMAFLRHHHMADANAVVHVRQVLLLGPVTGNAHDAARIIVLLGHIVVHHQHHLGLVPDLRTELFEHGLEPARAGRVMEHGQIDPAIENLADSRLRATGGFGQKFLGQRLGLHSGSAHDCKVSLTEMRASMLPTCETSSWYS